ncbi:response regulator transcription factor [Petropleomorpha daqingensis]|uniref:DNA-binding response OmpR family regulator n=1 Tax=Petropleomorpha daqingensis TaxID=2026353 RepID=A0A853CNV0_9ACTN|nr:DNA-binding response OmpR family regulator [Petropleomorpha daqingensis]
MPAVPDPAAPPWRVLVVDDEPAIRELLAMVCAYEGWDVRTAGTGEAALRAVRERAPDVVLLDAMLPDLDGLTVLRRIRASSPALPVIMVTARDSAEDRAALFGAGATGYVTKPFAVAALTEQVRRAFGQVAATTVRP